METWIASGVDRQVISGNRLNVAKAMEKLSAAALLERVGDRGHSTASVHLTPLLGRASRVSLVMSGALSGEVLAPFSVSGGRAGGGGSDSFKPPLRFSTLAAPPEPHLRQPQHAGPLWQ